MLYDMTLVYFYFMVSEKRKYISGILKNIGFALLVPLSSIVFQWIVFKKSLFLGHFSHAVIAFIVAWVFIVSGCTVLVEKK